MIELNIYDHAFNPLYRENYTLDVIITLYMYMHKYRHCLFQHILFVIESQSNKSNKSNQSINQSFNQRNAINKSQHDDKWNITTDKNNSVLLYGIS